VLVLLLASTVLPTVASGSSDSTSSWNIKTLGTKLPYAVYRGGSVWTGKKEYIISGRTDQQQVDTVIEFDPSTGKAVVKNAHVPQARIMMGAAWLSPYIYIFGGLNLSTILDDVVRYDPVSDVAQKMSYKMPYTRVGVTAVSIGDSILVMGGRNETDYFSTVLRFYPSNGTFVSMAPTPVKGGGRTGVYTGDKVYLFGSCINAKGHDVLEIDPSADTTQEIDVGPPHNFYWASSAWVGDSALVFGGDNYTVAMDQFLEFKPTTAGKGELKSIGKLPKPIEQSAAFYDKSTGNAYLLGGRSTTTGLNDIYVISKNGTGTGTATVTPERAFLVGGVMLFVVLVVAVQAYFDKAKKVAKNGEASDQRPTRSAKPGKPSSKDKRR
jgi:hypothetical protein